MSTIIELYNQVSKRVQELNARIKSAEDEILKISTAFSGDNSARIARLEEQLVKIDDYLLKIKGFQELAKKNIDSLNVLTIEAPPGYRVNLNRLRNWAMMIDPTSDNDPYAQRVYLVAKCDECFLVKKQQEFRDRICQLNKGEDSGISDEIEILQKSINSLKLELKQYAMSEEVSEFAQVVLKENNKFWHKISPTTFNNHTTLPSAISPGAYAAPFSFDVEQRNILKGIMGDFYDADNGRVLLPVEINNNNEYVMTISCALSKRKKLDRALQNLVLTSIHENPAGARKIYVLDGVRFNSSSMGSLRDLEGTYAMEQIPRNPEQLTTTLEKIVSSFADIDELLELHDSVAEYNESMDLTNRVQLSTIIIFGWSNSFEGRNKDLIQRIMTNYERYGISFITVTYQNLDKKSNTENNAMPEYATQNAIHISMTQNENTISYADTVPQRFTWYTFSDSLSPEYVDSVKKNNVLKVRAGNEYINRVKMEPYVPYERGKKDIIVPYGIDSKDQMHSISFDNENFAMYLMGASGSGKSTLLHTLITGILKDYHPDDVELWLADFKMSEFAQYMDPLPPHIKYILLDESPELVYDLLDKLTEKMIERQRFFMKHRDMKKVENVPKDIYMPIIFVVLDEFSIMSQAVSESEIYKLRLQNLLAKGRALGIKFIFASQTFTKGIQGLTQTAKDQIQMRIAMKNSYNEINETLELSSNVRTEKVKNWMDALPPHYALSKHREGDGISIKRLEVMYFKGKGDEALIPQRNLINHINNKMRPCSIKDYNIEVLDTYVDKHPVIVDGNSYKAFNSIKIADMIYSYKKEHIADISNEDIVMTFGSPRKMATAKFATITNESRENLLMISRVAEQSCGMSIIMTAIKSFELQKGNVQIWAYSKNRMYHAYKEDFFNEYSVSEGISEICQSISNIKEKIANKEIGNDLIILLGMEQICNDFDLIDFGSSFDKMSSRKANLANTSQYEAKSEEELQEVAEVIELQERFMTLYDIDQLEDKWIDEGKSIEEIQTEIDLLYREFLEKIGMKLPESNTTDIDDVPTESLDTYVDEDISENTNMAYNASEDFKYIVKQGSRFGYHFMLCLNNLSDIRTTQLQAELFRHKIVFQISGDDSISLFATKVASRLPEHICQYTDTLEQYSLRPFIHEGISWDGWDIDTDGEATNKILI